jgi:hypothetical protein
MSSRRRNVKPIVSTAASLEVGAPTTITVETDSSTFVRVALIIVCLRVTAGIFCQSYGAPDEHWQVIEAAHGHAFGSGYATWEWWPEVQLRSLGPVGTLAFTAFTPLRQFAMFVWGADAARTLPLSAVWAAPKVVAAIFGLFTDYAVYRLALAVWNGDKRAARNAALAHASSWPALIFGARASANAASATLLAIALAAAHTAVWGEGGDSESEEGPRQQQHRRRRRRHVSRLIILGTIAGAAGAAATIVHPTTASALLGYAIFVLCNTPLLRQRIGFLLAMSAVFGAVLIYMCERIADASIRGGSEPFSYVAALTAPPPAFAFIRANIVEGVDALSGVHGLFWYLFIGVPAAIGVWAPAVVSGLRATQFLPSPTRSPAVAAPLAPAFAALALLFALSLAAHKELRYLAPFAPIAAVYAGRGMTGVQWTAARWATPSVIAINALVALYILSFHQRGPVAAVEFVAQAGAKLLALKSKAAAQQRAHHNTTSQTWTDQWTALASELAPLSVHQLMPCHSAPAFATLHWPIEFRILDCSPGAALGGGGGVATRARDRALSAAISVGGAVCAVGGGTSFLPPISESRAWVLNKTALLLAMYGEIPERPYACSRIMMPPPPPPVLWSALITPGSETNESIADVLFSVPPAAFVRTFGVASTPCIAALTTALGATLLLPARALPSHALLYDTDVMDSGVAMWLSVQGFQKVASFSMGHVNGDSHSKMEGRGEPSSVLVFQHQCWQNNVGKI